MDVNDGVIDEAFRNTFADAPQLVALCGTFWDDAGLATPPFAFPWHQLTIDALVTLQNMPNLIECQLRYSEGHDILPTTAIRLLHLISLTIQFGDPSDEPAETEQSNGSTLLNHLETPRLEKLMLHGAANASVILALLRRSGCAKTLELLHLYSIVLYKDRLKLLDIVRETTHLAEIDFQGMLASRSSTTSQTFLSAFHSQWLRVQETRGSPRTRFYMRGLWTPNKDAMTFRRIFWPMRMDQFSVDIVYSFRFCEDGFYGIDMF
jgi:hypothetical protein